MQKKVKEISPNYVDEHESDTTVKYKNKDLKMITIDLFLKNIISTDFLDKYINYVYYFSQQCFCFIPKETLFQKIINCYTYFKKLNSPFIHLKKIIYFLDLIIIEMYEYYHSVPSKSLSQIKKFYRNLEEDLKKKLGISNKDKSSTSGKGFSNKFGEKVKLMGKIVDRLKSNPNIIIDKGKIKEETNIPNNNANQNVKNEKNTSDRNRLAAQETAWNDARTAGAQVGRRTPAYSHRSRHDAGRTGANGQWRGLAQGRQEV